MSWFDKGSAAEGYHRTLGVSGLGGGSSGNVLGGSLGAGGGAPTPSSNANKPTVGPALRTAAPAGVTAKPGTLPGTVANKADDRAKEGDGKAGRPPVTPKTPVITLLPESQWGKIDAGQVGIAMLKGELETIAKEPDPKKRGELCAGLALVKAAVEKVGDQMAAAAFAQEVLLPRMIDIQERAVLGVRMVRALADIDVFARKVTAPNYDGTATLEIPKATIELAAKVQNNTGLAVALKQANDLAQSIAGANAAIVKARAVSVQGKLPYAWTSRLAIYSAQCFVPEVDGQSATKQASWISIPARCPREPSWKALVVAKMPDDYKPEAGAYGGAPFHTALNVAARSVYGYTPEIEKGSAYNTVQSFGMVVTQKDDDWSPAYTVNFVRGYETTARVAAMVAVKARADLVCQFLSALTKIVGAYAAQTVMRVPANPDQAPPGVGGDYSWLVCPVVNQPEHWKYAASLAYWIAQDPAQGPAAAKDNYAKVRKWPENEIKPDMAFPYSGPDSLVEQARAAYKSAALLAMDDSKAKAALASVPVGGLQEIVQAKAKMRMAVQFADAVSQTLGNGAAILELESVTNYIIDAGMTVGVKPNPPAGLTPEALGKWFADFIAACWANPPPASMFARLKWAATTISLPGEMAKPDTPELQLAVAVWSELQPQLSQISAMCDLRDGNAKLGLAENAAQQAHMNAAKGELSKGTLVKVAIPGSAPPVEFTAQIVATEADFAKFASAQAVFDKAAAEAEVAAKIAAAAKAAADKLAAETGAPPDPSKTPPADEEKPPEPPKSGMPWGLIAAAVGAKIAFG